MLLVFPSKNWLNTRKAMTFKPQEGKREKEREAREGGGYMCVNSDRCQPHIWHYQMTALFFVSP